MRDLAAKAWKTVQSERKLNFAAAFYHWREGASGAGNPFKLSSDVIARSRWSQQSLTT